MFKKQLPMGIDSFRELREGDYYYSDKSMMIADFLQTGAKVTLITRPRRFGKTLGMDMVKEFFDIDAESEAIFQGLAIMDTGWRDQMNTRPVISFSFRDCKGPLLPLVLSIKNELAREYERFQDIVKPSGRIEEIQYERILSCLLNGQEDVALIGNAIQFLSKLVARHYDQSPIILIDEYDTPMTSAYNEGGYDGLRSFFTSLYGSALKGNQYLGQALLTGIQRITGLNNLVVCTINDPAYSQYFGFDRDEARMLLETYGLELTDEVRQMYGGYGFGEREVYNPWSLLSYAGSGKLDPYWVNTSANTMIRRCVLKADQDFLDHFDELILNGSTKVSANLQTSFFELQNNATLWGMLMSSGYITTVRELNLLTGFCEIRIPNLEVAREFQSIVAQRARLEDNLLNEMFYYLIQERNAGQFVKAYKRIVLTVTSYYDAKENAYHMLMLGMCVYLSGIYEITSNLEAGLGRSDITLRAKEPGRFHIVIEFKQGDDLQKLAREALTQIKDKEYTAGLSGEVLLMGIAHQKKECEIDTEFIQI